MNGTARVSTMNKRERKGIWNPKGKKIELTESPTTGGSEEPDEKE